MTSLGFRGDRLSVWAIQVGCKCGNLVLGLEGLGVIDVGCGAWGLYSVKYAGLYGVKYAGLPLRLAGWSHTPGFYVQLVLG